jgi:cytochrome c peroxidase
MTPPYFHYGSVERLPEAVSIMARVQPGKKAGEISQIIAFLDSLTGELPADFASSPRTAGQSLYAE